MNIEELLHKYFEGETSAEEEKQIRQYFFSGNIPSHLNIYKPYFGYFDEEIEKHQQEKNKRKFTLKRPAVYYILSGIVASILLLIGISKTYWVAEPCLCMENYVVINGRCYTDIEKIRELAFEALQEVAVPAEEYFPNNQNDYPDKIIIEEQLREFSSLFSDDE